MKKCPFLICLLSCLISISQEKKFDDIGVLIKVDGDSIARSEIKLNEVTVYPPLQFNSYDDKIRYYNIKRKTLKVYPYAVLASERLEELNKRLPLIKGKNQKKRYTKIVEKFIEKEFSEELKKLTRSEGQILIKLVHRETGQTVYKLISKLRNVFRAFSYNSLARLFKISIKVEFDPINNDEDAVIEDVLKRAYADNSIKLELDR